jgi:hypothetical protein
MEIPVMYFKTANTAGVKIFYREAGEPSVGSVNSGPPNSGNSGTPKNLEKR